MTRILKTLKILIFHQFNETFLYDTARFINVCKHGAPKKISTGYSTDCFFCLISADGKRERQ